MNKKSFLLGVVGLLALLPLGAKADNVQMPQWGKQVVVVPSGETLNYYDYKGCYMDGSTTSGFSADAYSTTIFQPATAGEKVQIVFEKVLLTTDYYEDDSYASLKIYNGVFDTTSVTYSKYSLAGFPKTSNLIEDLSDGTFSNKTYLSTDATGALSVCLHAYTTDWDKQGWKAVVTTVSSSPMEVKSATADYTNARSELFVSEPNVVLGGVQIQAKGTESADHLTSLSFTLSGTVFDANQVRLYRTKEATVAGLTPVATTITKSGETYTLTLNEALESGTNSFVLAADMQAKTPVGATSTLTISGLTTAKGFTTLTPATPKTQTVSEVRMVNNAHIYVYVSGEMPFYDDGGVDGKISKNFNGYITFLPSTAGKKVQIDMHDISLFYTSSAAGFDRQDILAFYNGTTATADSLVYTVEAAKLDNYTLKSTADNGALTIYLRSKEPSDYYQGTGFEAVVSEFAAQAMTMTGSSVSKKNSTVSGCTSDAQVMSFSLTTENTEPALMPTLFRFNTGNTFAAADSATLYYTGSSADNTPQRVGKVGVESNQFSIPATALSLSEGTNYFYLTYDVACNVANEQQLSANIEQVDFSNGTEYKGFDNPEGALRINNTWYSSCGEKTLYIYGEWVFTHTPQDEYSTSYKAEDCNQTTVFVPTTEGRVIEMDFSDFAVSFNSYSKATFRIYEGQGTTGALLWEADKDNCATGPGVVRSGASDGALTVVFNANTEFRTYVGAGKGWHAAVREYQPRPMTIDSTRVNALSADALVRGQKKAELLSLSIATSGNLTPLGLKSVSLTLNDCAQAVDSLFLLRGEAVVARAEVSGTAVVLTANTPLAEGDNTYTIVADIAADATLGTTVSVEAMSLAIGEATLTPTVPQNGRTVRNMYLLQSGTQRVEVDATPLSFYDNGGPEGKLTLGLKGTVTFVPTIANTAIELNFKQWAINGADNFYVYYGENTKDKADVSLSYYTKDIDQLMLISTDATGALTITYESKGTLATDGWEIEVRCHELQPLRLDSIVMTDKAPQTITRGSQDVVMLQAALHVSGDRGKMPVENFNIGGTLGASAKVYATGTLGAFAATNLLTAADTITNQGIYYYWIALDIPADTEEGTVVTANLQSVSVNNLSVEPKNSVTASMNIIGGMHGTYIIGASDKAQYKTIQSAVDAMKNGIESAVTFLIEPGTYTEYIVVPEIDGTSEDNRVTFRSQTGNSEDVIVRYDNYSPSSSPLGDATQGTFTFNGADYVTLSNLTLTTNNESYHAVVFVCNQAEHITIDSCYIYRATTTGATNARVVYAYANKETTNNNYFTLSHSTLKGGYIGVALTGNFTNKEIGGRILNNTIEEQGSMGIYLSGGERKAVVDGNVVRNCTTTKTSTKAIDLTLEEGCQISNNHIYTDLSVNADGIYLRAVNGTEAEPVYIYNNVVEHHCDASSSSYAININRATKNVYLAHNTVQTQGEGVYPLYIRTTQTNLHVQNNLFLSSNNPAVWVPSANYVKDCTIAHNNLYAEQGAFGKIGATEYSDIEAWRTAIKSTSDISEAVQFESEEVLRPVQKGNLVSGEVLAFVTTDISGKARAAVPTLGAYEWIDPTSTSLSTAEQGALLVFPTITADMLHIVGAEGKEVRIVNMQGQVVMRSMLNGTTLDVQALPQGTYLLQAEQHIVRFIKK